MRENTARLLISELELREQGKRQLVYEKQRLALLQQITSIKKSLEQSNHLNIDHHLSQIDTEITSYSHQV